MAEYFAEVTAVSSKGQVVLPKAIRDSLSLVSGTKLMVLNDGDSILLKPIRKPSITEFRAMMDQTAKWAEEAGMQESDVDEAITAVRKARRATK